MPPISSDESHNIEIAIEEAFSSEETALLPKPTNQGNEEVEWTPESLGRGFIWIEFGSSFLVFHPFQLLTVFSSHFL